MFLASGQRRHSRVYLLLCYVNRSMSYFQKCNDQWSRMQQKSFTTDLISHTVLAQEGCEPPRQAARPCTVHPPAAWTLSSTSCPVNPPHLGCKKGEMPWLVSSPHSIHTIFVHWVAFHPQGITYCVYWNHQWKRMMCCPLRIWQLNYSQGLQSFGCLTHWLFFFCFSKPNVFPDRLTAVCSLSSHFLPWMTRIAILSPSPCPPIYHSPSLREKHLHGLVKEASLGEALS